MDSEVSVVDKQTKINYNSWSKKDLVKRLEELENANNPSASIRNDTKTPKKRSFSWKEVSKRHILLKFIYFGWEYHGYTSQVDTVETVEEYMMNALSRCCLIESRETSNYHRCGRTDAGVSAFSQVISIDVRSKLKTPNESNTSEELEYCKMLNRLLPTFIRCYAWCHVGTEVSARFDCTSRSYNYFFPKGNLDIGAMSLAAKHLEGTHDFRNLCKMDVGNGVVEFTRTIDEAFIIPVNEDKEPGFSMFKLVIKSRGFLWHQIRCIMAVLLLVGEGNEEPSIIAELLNVKEMACKPQYQMANPIPLSLATADYKEHQLKWNFSSEEIDYLFNQLQGLWAEFSIKESMVRDALSWISKLAGESFTWRRQTHLFTGIVPKVHIPLLKRPTCQSLEERLLNVQRRKKAKTIEGCEEKKQMMKTKLVNK